MALPFDISEVELLPLKPVGGMVAWASMLVNQSLYLGSIGVHIRPGGGVRLVYPQRTLPNGKTISLFHPTNRHTGDLFESVVEAKLTVLTSKM